MFGSQGRRRRAGRPPAHPAGVELFAVCIGLSRVLTRRIALLYRRQRSESAPISPNVRERLRLVQIWFLSSSTARSRSPPQPMAARSSLRTRATSMTCRREQTGSYHTDTDSSQCTTCPSLDRRRLCGESFVRAVVVRRDCTKLIVGQGLATAISIVSRELWSARAPTSHSGERFGSTDPRNGAPLAWLVAMA